MRRAAILVAFLATGALSVPTGERSEPRCTDYCEPSSDVRSPVPVGRTHVFEYSADVVTTLAGSTDEESRLHATATVEVTGNTECDLSLQLRDVTLKDSDPRDASSKQEVDNMATFKQELERWPLHFNYQNGNVLTLCGNPEEPVWVLNFKRGVLSNLVTVSGLHGSGETHRMERDVTGQCLTEYKMEEHGDSQLVTKKKDLLSCSGRGHLVSALQSTPYTSASDVQSLPLVKSSLHCEQKVTKDRLVSTECHENHLFRPFSQGENGAVTHVTTRLSRVAERRALSDSYRVDMPTSRYEIAFDHTDAELKQQNRVPAAAALLAQLQEKTADGVRPEVPHLFTRLVRMLRHFDEQGLASLDAQLEDGSAAQRYFVDALPLAGAAPAMALMRGMITNGRVSNEVADRWMTALAFVHEPTAEMVEAVAPLLEVADARRQTLLGVSSLVHHYCRREADCADHAAVRRAIVALERALGTDCRARSEEEELKLLTTLKALGNAGRLVNGAEVLRSCFENDNTMEVRLAAIQAYRRMPCSAVADSGLMNTFSNEREDTEVRIAAYLAVMQCPTHQIVDKVQEILATDSVNQVSSFVWSHLTNMQETGDPTKRYMKSLLYNIDLANKFNADVRKFSRYFEKSMFFDSMNAGATVDANVIFTPESYIPKSGMFNFTVDLFGQAFNLLEVGGRMEGMEDFSESLFGDKGIYPQEVISQIMKTMRGRQANAVSSRRIQSPKASAYMKIFGNELQFKKYESLNELVNSLGAKNPLDFLQKLAKDMDWTENYQFLDSSYTIPTIAGFPFTLKATGSATVSLKTGGTFDFKSWDEVNIDGHIKPSAAVEIASEMLVDAHVAHTGLKMNSNLHTSTVLDGHAIVDSGKLVSVRINMPRDKVEILDVNTRFHSVFRNKARKLEMHTGDRFEIEACSDRYISTDLLGINLCADVSYSRGTPGLSSYLFSGPLTARFVVEKTDTFKAFEFEYRHSNSDGIRKSNFFIDRVGSAVDRRISVDYLIDYEQNKFQAGFHTPIKSMDVSGVLNLAGKTKRADVSLKMDDRELFGITSSMLVEDTSITARYSPSISIRGLSGELANFDGSLIANKMKHKYNVDLTITKIFQTPVVLKGSFNDADGTYNVATSLNSFILDGNMKGTFRFAGDSLLIRTNTEYSFMNGERQTISVNSKMSEKEVDGITTHKLFVNSKFSALPMLDSQLTVERQASKAHRQIHAVLTREDRTYELTTELNGGRDEASGSLGFVAKHWDVDFKLAGGADFSKKSKILLKGEAQLNSEKFVRATVGLDYKSEPAGFNYGVFTELALPMGTYTLSTGVRQEDYAAHLRVVTVRDTAFGRDEVALVAALALEDEETNGELTLSIPSLPRYELSARVVPGAGGLYLARARLQAGELSYTAGTELRMVGAQNALSLLLELPSQRYSAQLDARLEGDRQEVTADLRFGRRVTAAFTTNLFPSENTASFEIFWNKDVDETQKASAEVLLRSMDVAATLKYPGRHVKLDGTLTADGLTAEIAYAPKKVIHVVGGIRDRGHAAFVDITTPIEGFHTMSLTFTERPDTSVGSSEREFELVGVVEDQQARLVASVMFDLPYCHGCDRSAIETKLHLVSPVPGWEYAQLAFSYVLDSNSFTTRLMAAKNADKFALGGTFELFTLPEVFKVSTALDLELPTDALRKGKVGFDLKFGEKNLDTNILAQWTTYKDHELSLALTSEHSVDREINIDSVLTLKTPFAAFRGFTTHLKFNYGSPANFNTLLSIRHGSASVFHVELVTSDELYSQTGKFVFNCAMCPRLNVAYGLNRYRQESFTLDASSSWTGQETSLSLKYAIKRPGDGVQNTDFSVSLVLPTETSTYALHQSHEVNIPEGKMTEHTEIKWGSKSIVVDMNSGWEVQQNGYGGLESMLLTGSGQMTTPFHGWESATISQTIKVTKLSTQPTYYGYTKIMNREDKALELIDNVEFKNGLNWHLQRTINSNSRWISHATISVRSIGDSDNVTLTSDAEWDGETAQLAYAHAVGNMDFAASLSGKWFGGVTRSLKVAARNAAEAFYPSLDITYNDSQTMRLYGSIAKNLEEGESSVTLEAPFTARTVLTIGHDLRKKKFTVDCLHGQNRYTVEMDAKVKHYLGAGAKLDVKFSSPRSCFGDGSFEFKYDVDDELKFKSKLSHNDWEISADAKLEIEKGHLTINTPHQGFTALSAFYTCTGDGAELRLKREHRQILIAVNHIHTPDVVTYNMRVNTPYAGYETITLTITKSLYENSYTIEYLRGRHASASAIVKFELSGPSSWITVEAQSSLEGLSTASAHLGYNLIDQKARVMFVKEGKKMEVHIAAELTAPYSKISVGFINNLADCLPEQLTLTGMYDVRDVKKTAEVVLLNGEDKFLLGGDVQCTEDSHFVILTMSTPIRGLESGKFVASYDSSLQNAVAKLKLSRNEDAFAVVFAVEDTTEAGNVALSVRTPFEAFQLTKLSAEYDTSTTPVQAKLTAVRNSDQYDIIASLEERPDSMLVSLTTPFNGFERMSFEGSCVRNGAVKSARFVASRNEDQITLTVDTEFSWTKSMISIDASSPFAEVRSLGLMVLYDFQNEQKTASALLVKNGKRYQINTYGVMRSGAASCLIELNTPVDGWEDVKYQATYDLNTDEKLMEISYERNGVKKVIASRGSFDGEVAYVDVITPLEGYETMGISGRYISKRGKREAGYDAHVNGHRHRLHVVYERVGMESATLKIESPIEDMHLIQVDARSQKFPDGMGYYINTNRDGKRSSVEIRTIKEDNSVGVDISVKSYITGLENLKLSGNVVYRGKRRSFSFKSVKGGTEAEISGQAVMKRRAGNGQLKVALPIAAWEDVDASFDYKLGRRNTFRLTSTRGGVTREYSGDLQYTDSSFTVNLNTPFNGFKKLHADAARTESPDGKISAAITLQRGNRKITINYGYKFAAGVGSANIDITTPYNGFSTVSSALDYNMGSKSRSISFRAKRDAREWSLETSRTWSKGTDEGSLTLRTPIDEAKIIKFSRSFDIKNMANMRYEANYERNGRKFALSGTGSVTGGGKKVALNADISTPLEIGDLGAKVSYDFSKEPREIHAKLSAGARYANLDASIGSTGGYINLATTNPMLPKADVTYTAQIGRNKRQVTASLVLHDGRTLQLDYLADFSKKNKANGHINVQSTTYGDRKLVWDYKTPGDDLAGSLQYNSPNGNIDWSISVDGKAYVRRKVVIKSTINSEIYSSTWTATLRYNTKSGFNTYNKLIYNGKEYAMTFDAQKDGGKRVVSATFNGQLLKNIKIDGSWTLPGNPSERKEFDIAYKRGNRKASLKGWFSVGASGKSGSGDIQVTTPFEVVNSLHVACNWNFVLPNRILKIDYNRNNGRTASLNFYGTRNEDRNGAYGDYSLALTFPEIDIAPRISISEYASSFAFDLRNGVMFKIAHEKPVIEKLEFDLKNIADRRTVKAVYHFEDKKGMVPYLTDKHIEFTSERQNRPQGPKIDLVLKTNIQGFEKVEASFDVNMGSDANTITIDYKRGRKSGHITASIGQTAEGGNINFNAQTTMKGFEAVSLSGSYQHQPAKLYGLNLDYSRDSAYVRLTSSTKLDIKKAYGVVQSASIDADLNLDANVDLNLQSGIEMPINLAITLDSSMENQPRRSGQIKLVVAANGRTWSLTHTVNRVEAGRRKAKLIITTPYKYPYKRITYNGDVSLASNSAVFSVEYGKKKIELDVSWYAGEASQYGAELRLNTPFRGFKAIELDAKATLQRREAAADVLVHYRRDQKMVHVTGTVRPYILDLHFETPTFGNFNVKAGVTVNDNVEVDAVVSFEDGRVVGGSVSFKPRFKSNDMELAVNVFTPVPGWERLSFDIAYTNVQGSNIVRVAFESPLSKRLELSFELTNRTARGTTDFKAGVTTNYLGNAFTFRTNILRDAKGMKYELELESPYHLLPSFRLTGRR